MVESQEGLADAVLEDPELRFGDSLDWSLVGIECRDEELDELDVDLLQVVGSVDENELFGRIAIGLVGDCPNVGDLLGRR